MNKTLGFGTTTPGLPLGKGYVMTAAQVAIMKTMKGPFLSSSTSYLYIDKLEFDAQHASGNYSDEEYTKIKGAIERMIGTAYDKIPDIYEGYRIVPLGSWQNQAPAP